MAGERWLLVTGNDKLGASIHGWSIPAIRTCPGRTQCCSSVCYATHGRFVTTRSKQLMEWRLQQARQRDFADRMSEEVFRRGVLVLRVHVAGDFFTPTYTARWVEIATRSPHTRFFAYTRSWRVPKIEPYLRAFAGLPNVRLWYSADRESGLPASVPDGVRVAWMQDSEAAPPGGDLVFQVPRLRRLSLPLAVPVCGQELPQGRARGVNCANCALCWE